MTPSAGSFPAYAISAVLFVYGGIGLLIYGAVLWERFEQRLARRSRPSNIVSFPVREATVTRIHGKDAS